LHKREEIKAEIVSMLQAGLTENVYPSRYLPISQKDFPAISVYCPEEDAVKNESEELYTRTAKVVIAIYDIGKDDIELSGTAQKDIDGKLDDLCTKVETIFLTQYQTLNKVVYRFNLTKTRYMVKTEGDEITGIAYMDFDAIYHDKII
jgi:hypothetical protein